MSDYEMVLIFKTEAGDKVKTELQKTIKDLKGKVGEEKSWGERELAYPIKKEEKGIYLLLNFSLGASKIPELNKTLRLKEEILRFLIIKQGLPSRKPKVKK